MASEAPKPTPPSPPVSKPVSPEPKPASPVSKVTAPANPVAVTVHSTGASHSAVPARPAATTHIPPAPHPSVAPKAANLMAKPPAPARPEPAPIDPTPAASTPAPTFRLPSAVYSPQLLESVIYDIQYYLDWYRQNQIRKRVGAKPKGEPNHSDETVLVIEAWLAGKPATLETLEALLNHLKTLNLPEVHIMLAALPNRAQRATLVDWFRNNTTDQLLVSFVADRNLGGGIVVRTPNRVFDYTWKQQLVAGRSKLAGILKRV